MCVVGTGVDGVGVVVLLIGARVYTLDWSKYINPAIINTIVHEFEFLCSGCTVTCTS